MHREMKIFTAIVVGALILTTACAATSIASTKEPVEFLEPVEVALVPTAQKPQPIIVEVEEIAPVQGEEEIAPGITDNDRIFMYYCIQAEAGNQSELVKRLCTDVIINRMHDPDWADTIRGVITEPHQFSVWGNGSLMKAVPTEETIEAVNKEIEKQISNDIVYFNSIGFIHGERWEQVGDMYFMTKGEKK